MKKVQAAEDILPQQQVSAASTNFLPKLVSNNDPKKWRTNVPNYAKVKYQNIYPGVDMVYYGNQGGQLEYDFVVAPALTQASSSSTQGRFVNRPL